jgi:hypothetical protein
VGLFMLVAVEAPPAPADTKLLDSKVVPIGDSGLDGCKAKVASGKGSVVVTTECTNGGDLRGRKCKEGEPDQYLFTAQITVNGSTVEAAQTKKMTDGQGCVELP